MKTISLIRALFAVMAMGVSIFAPAPADAKNILTVVSATQAPSAQLWPGALQELARATLDVGGVSAIDKVHVTLLGAVETIDALVVVSQEDRARTVIDKNGSAVIVHDLTEKVIARLDIDNNAPVVVGKEPLPVTSVDSKEFSIPIDNNVLQANGAQKSYVVYGLVGYRAYQHVGKTIQARITYMLTDEDTQLGWSAGDNTGGSVHTFGWGWVDHPTVLMEAEKSIVRTVVESTRSVVLGSVSVDVSYGQVTASNIEFELQSSTVDAKLFAGLLDIRVVDGAGKILPGTRPVKPQFKLEDNRVKIVFPGMYLRFEDGKTSLKIMGRFGAYNKNNTPLVTMVLKPKNWIWVDYIGSRIDPQAGFGRKTIVCPPIYFAGRRQKGG
jgi:hypothetical protein